jgi:putative oxidoreductase
LPCGSDAIQWFRYATGILEVAGGILLLIPPATSIAVAILGCTMIAATLVEVFVVGDPVSSIIPASLFAAVAAVWWRHRPGGVDRQYSG